MEQLPEPAPQDADDDVFKRRNTYPILLPDLTSPNYGSFSAGMDFTTYIYFIFVVFCILCFGISGQGKSISLGVCIGLTGFSLGYSGFFFISCLMRRYIAQAYLKLGVVIVYTQGHERVNSKHYPATSIRYYIHLVAAVIVTAIGFRDNEIIEDIIGCLLIAIFAYICMIMADHVTIQVPFHEIVAREGIAERIKSGWDLLVVSELMMAKYIVARGRHMTSKSKWLMSRDDVEYFIEHEASSVELKWREKVLYELYTTSPRRFVWETNTQV